MTITQSRPDSGDEMASSVQKPLDLALTLKNLEHAASALATLSVSKMDETLPWFRALPPEQRSWITLIAQTGISAFIDWIKQNGQPGSVSGDIFAAAPRDLARAITLQQAVALMRTTIDVVESQVEQLSAPGERSRFNEGILKFSREVAFSAAYVYARAAETRGAWDTRLQALLVDAIFRGDSSELILSRTAALGWTGVTPVTVIVGDPPVTATGKDINVVLDYLHKIAKQHQCEILGSIHDEHLTIILGGTGEVSKILPQLLDQFGPGPIVIGPSVSSISDATKSAHMAAAGLKAAPAWPDAPRPVSAVELLPERFLIGDDHATRELIHGVFIPLRDASGGLLETLASYLEHGGALESTARAMFVHPNTVRYRLKRIIDVTGLSPANARDAFTLHLALRLGWLHH